MLRKLEKNHYPIDTAIHLSYIQLQGGAVLRKMDSDLGNNDFLQLLHKS